jgi:hypothetical protein
MPASTVVAKADGSTCLLREAVLGRFRTRGEASADLTDLIGGTGRKANVCAQPRRATFAKPSVIAIMLRAVSQEIPIVRLMPKSARTFAEPQHRTLGAVR